MALPKETRDRIVAEAAAKTGFKDDEDSTPISKGHYYGYIVGATAEAEKAQEAIDILEEAYNSHVEEKELLIERYPHLFPNIDNYIKPWVAKAKEFLQQFKDGKGKEYRCPHCGKELSRDRNLCCRECGKEVENG